jgi:hypothetical protein
MSPDRPGTELVFDHVALPSRGGVVASSLYVRDPDGNLLECTIYPEASHQSGDVSVGLGKVRP